MARRRATGELQDPCRLARQVNEIGQFQPQNLIHLPDEAARVCASASSLSSRSIFRSRRASQQGPGSRSGLWFWFWMEACAERNGTQ